MSQDQFYSGKGEKTMTTEHEDLTLICKPSNAAMLLVGYVVHGVLLSLWLGGIFFMSHNMPEVQEPCRTSAEVIENELALIILGDEYDPQLKVPPRKPEVLR